MALSKARKIQGFLSYAYQISKMTRSESELLTAIQDSGQSDMSIADMQVITGRSNSTIYNMIHGYNSHGNHCSSLLERCPA